MVGDCVTPAEMAPPVRHLRQPESTPFTVPSDRTLRFAGFRSRWMMPCRAPLRAPRRSARDGEGFVDGIAPCAMRSRASAPQPFHHERVMPPGLLEAVDRGNVGMVERRQRLRFAVEAARRSDPGHRSRQHLIGAWRRGSCRSRDRPLQSAHANLGQRSHTGEAGTWIQRQTDVIIWGCRAGRRD